MVVCGRVVPAKRGRIGPLLAGTLGVAVAAALAAALALAAPKPALDAPKPGLDAPKPALGVRNPGSDEDIRDEVVVSAARLSDEVLVAKVTTAVQQQPYIFSNHLTVTAENGVVRLEGRLSDRHDLLSVLRLARRIAGKGRVVNNIEFAPSDDDSEH
jgi:hypothetical protein